MKMSTFETISFKMEDRVDGREITPETIGFESFNRFNKSDNLWVETERYLIGRVQDMGGKSSANVHLDVPGQSKTIKIDSSQEYLRSQDKNLLYHDVQVRILAEQNIRTRELRNVRLIEFAGRPPSYNEDELNQAIQKGTAAWADVEDITKWVSEQRGSYDA